MKEKNHVRKRKKNLFDIDNCVRKKRHSSTDITSNGIVNAIRNIDEFDIPLERKSLLLNKSTENLNQCTTQSNFLFVWICQNRQLDQQTEINLGFSPCLNVLIEQIYKYFNRTTEDMILTRLSNDGTWLEVPLNDVNISLINLGINHHSTISVEEKLHVNNDASDLQSKSIEKTYLTVKHVSFNRDIQIEFDGNTTLAMLKEKIRSEFGSNFRIDYLQINTANPSITLPEEDHTSSSVSVPSTPVVRTDQNKNLENLVKTHGHYGLRNLGNTCFMNSALQSLSNVQSLTDYFLINGNNITGDLAQAYYDFIEHIWISGQLYNPKSIRTCICYYAPQFDNFEQHDAHEFLIFLLNQLHEDLKDEEQASSIILNLFNCQIDTITTCLTCKKTRRTPNSLNFIPLSLDQEKKTRRFQIHFESSEVSVEINANGFIEDLVRQFLIESKEQQNYPIEGLFERLTVISTNTNEQLQFNISLNDVLDSNLNFLVNDEIQREEKENMKHEVQPMELVDCLEEFTALETPNHQWFCKMECNQRVYIAKRMLLGNLSSVLIIQLKRFTESNGCMRKLDTFVNFPIDELDLKRFMIDQEEPMLYDLVTVINHTGNIHRGHYTTYARQLNDPLKQWFCFNDDQVTLIDQNEVVSTSAYILTYVKRK